MSEQYLICLLGPSIFPETKDVELSHVQVSKMKLPSLFGKLGTGRYYFPLWRYYFPLRALLIFTLVTAAQNL